jgi:hypothetical protein
MTLPQPQKTIFWLFFLGIVTQRLTVIQGDRPVPFALVLYLLAAVLLFMRKGMVIRRGLFIGVLAVMSMLVVTTLLSTKDFSLNSLLYLFVLYLPFCFVSADAEASQSIGNEGYRWFTNMMCVFALIALFQYGSQAFLHIPYHDPLAFLPQGFTMTNYEVSYPTQYGSEIYKSNAYLFLEPSFLSQFLALSLIIEILLFRRISVIVLQILGIASTFSGTGLLLIAITLPFAVLANIHKPRVALLGSVVIVAILAAVAFNPAVTKRSSEMNESGSSASIRFSTPYERMSELTFDSASSLLIGYGPGSVDRIKVDDRVANFPAVPKAIIEYGLLGGVPLLLLIAIRLFMGVGNLPIAVGLFCMQFFLSGALLQPISVFTLFYFFAMQPRAIPDAFGYAPSRTDLATG